MASYLSLLRARGAAEYSAADQRRIARTMSQFYQVKLMIRGLGE